MKGTSKSLPEKETQQLQSSGRCRAQEEALEQRHTASTEEYEGKVAAALSVSSQSSSLLRPGAVAVAGQVQEDPDDVLRQPGDTTALQADEGARREHDSLGRSADCREQTQEKAETTPTVVPLVQAELVEHHPTIEAYDVAIDEDEEHHAPTSYDHGRLPPLEVEQDDTPQKAWYGSSGGMIGLVAVLILMLVLFAIIAPLVVVQKDNQTSETVDITSYPCYTSTLDILLSQQVEAEVPGPYVICPNTTIQVGIFNNPATSDFSFVNGDYPISVIRPNITIQCGIDGKKENKCVIDGGFIHVLLMQLVPDPNGGLIVDNPIDNMLIRGITFTGQPRNSGPFNGASLAISHPGRNLRFEDCIWMNYATQSGLIGVGLNEGQELIGLPLEDGTIDVSFSDCIFQDIVYDEALLYVRGQTVRLERCIFRHNRRAALQLGACRTGPDGHGCAGVLFCGLNSTCVMDTVCVEDSSNKDNALVWVASSDKAEFFTKDLFLDQEVDCQLAVVEKGDSLLYNCSEIFTVGESCPIP